MSTNHIIPAGEGRKRPFMPGELFTWKTTGQDNGGAMDFGELSLEPGVRVPEHIHHGIRVRAGRASADVTTAGHERLGAT